MKNERLKMSIQTVKDNIKILESQEPEDAGYYLQLEHEKMVLNALEKQIPKKPVIDKYGCLFCGNCGSYDGIRTEINFIEGYCWECGQKIDTAHPTEKGGD